MRPRRGAGFGDRLKADRRFAVTHCWTGGDSETPVSLLVCRTRKWLSPTLNEGKETASSNPFRSSIYGPSLASTCQSI